MRNLVSIKGYVYNEEGTLTEQEFIHEFLSFMNLKGWLFMGVTQDEQDEV